MRIFYPAYNVRHSRFMGFTQGLIVSSAPLRLSVFPIAMRLRVSLAQFPWHGVSMFPTPAKLYQASFSASTTLQEVLACKQGSRMDQALSMM